MEVRSRKRGGEVFSRSFIYLFIFFFSVFTVFILDHLFLSPYMAWWGSTRCTMKCSRALAVALCVQHFETISFRATDSSGPSGIPISNQTFAGAYSTLQICLSRTWGWVPCLKFQIHGYTSFGLYSEFRGPWTPRRS